MKILGVYTVAYGSTINVPVSGTAIAVENLSNYVLQCQLPPAQYFYCGPQQGRPANLPNYGFSGNLSVTPLDPTGTVGAGTATFYINEYDGSDQIPSTPWGVISKTVTALVTSPFAHTKIWTDWPYTYGSLTPHSNPGTGGGSGTGSPPPFVAVENICLSLNPNMNAAYTAVTPTMIFAGFSSYLITPKLLQPYDMVIGFNPTNDEMGLVAVNDTALAGLTSADSGGTVIVNGVPATDWFITFWNPLTSWPTGKTTTPTLNWFLSSIATPINFATTNATTTNNNFGLYQEVFYFQGY